MAATDPGWEFDHIDPSLAEHMHDVFAEIRRRGPVVRTEEHGGYWAVMSYSAVREAFADFRAYSSAHGVVFPSMGVASSVRQYPINADPPEHTAYRRVIQKHFTRQAVAGYEDTFRELIRQRIRDVVAAGEVDLIPALAKYLPPVAIALVLGLPPADGEKFVSWIGQMFQAWVAKDFDTLGQLNDLLASYLSENLEQQLSGGAETVMTTIASTEVNGRPLTPDEQVQMILLLVLAGHETTVTSTATMLYHLATVAGLRQQLLDDPTLIPKMIDECLRLDGPTITMSRVVQHDTTLAGQPVRAGERLALMMSSANRDPEAFDRPDEFVCPRTENSHVAFGHGVHRCVGEHLARLELRVVAEEVLRHMPAYRLPAGFQPVWVPGTMMRGLTSLPAVIDVPMSRSAGPRRFPLRRGHRRGGPARPELK